MEKTKIYAKGDGNQRYQGDIAILCVEAPKEIEFKSFPQEGRLVVGHSETGHHHTIVAERTAEVEFAKDEQGYFLRIGAGGSATVVHEKVDGHEAQKLSEGTYYFSSQYEYDSKEDRKVVD